MTDNAANLRGSPVWKFDGKIENRGAHCAEAVRARSSGLSTDQIRALCDP
jgi:hypothetical protein